MRFRIYRYDPEKDAKPYLQDFDVALDKPARAGAPWTLHVHPPTR